MHVCPCYIIIVYILDMNLKVWLVWEKKCGFQSNVTTIITSTILNENENSFFLS